MALFWFGAGVVTGLLMAALLWRAVAGYLQHVDQPRIRLAPDDWANVSAELELAVSLVEDRPVSRMKAARLVSTRVH